MKTLPLLCLTSLLLVGCATPPPPKPTVATTPADQDTKAMVADGDAMLENIRAQEATRRAKAQANPIVPPGYEVRPVIFDESNDGKVHPTYRVEETTKTRLAREERERLAARESAIAQHPEWDARTIDAARTGNWFVGLPSSAVEAFFNSWHSRYASDGVGGKFEVWDYRGVATFYFLEGKLVRWSN